MEQWLTEPRVMAILLALLVVVAESLRRIIIAATNRAVAAIEGSARARQALSENELRRQVADDVVAAVEQLAGDADGGDKLQRALDMARKRGVNLVRTEIEAALKRAEGAWREPERVTMQFEGGGLSYMGPEGND